MYLDKIQEPENIMEFEGEGFTFRQEVCRNVDLTFTFVDIIADSKYRWISSDFITPDPI
jgi:hypothetical protein